MQPQRFAWAAEWAVAASLLKHDIRERSMSRFRNDYGFVHRIRGRTQNKGQNLAPRAHESVRTP